MHKFSKPAVATAVSMALALWAQQAALAQQAPAAPEAAKPAEPKPAEAKPKAPVTELAAVLVVGTRQSQQSAIGRKKHAATAQDSIVAEDVGAFPDRNIGEAISRIAGVALDRGDYGEGVNVSIRGNGPELTRVELDGQTVRSGAGTDLLGGGDGHLDATYAAARMLDLGEGVPAAPDRALVLYKEAALKGHADAQNALATFFYRGELVPQNLATARQLFQAAAQHRQPEAMFNLAVMLAQGQGGDKDLAAAYAWCSLSKNLGHEQATTALPALAARLSPEDKARAEAMLKPPARGS